MPRFPREGQEGQGAQPGHLGSVLGRLRGRGQVLAHFPGLTDGNILYSAVLGELASRFEEVL